MRITIICKEILISAKIYIPINKAFEYLKLGLFWFYIHKEIPQRQTELLGWAACEKSQTAIDFGIIVMVDSMGTVRWKTKEKGEEKEFRWESQGKLREKRKKEGVREISKKGLSEV